MARRLAEAEQPELSKYGDANFGVKALAALMAYREDALGRRSIYGTAARYWLEEGGAAWLLYYSPNTAYDRARRARAERPVSVEGMVAEALRRLFLRPGRDRYRRFVEELAKGGGLALELEREADKSLVFRLLKPEGGGRLAELEGVKLRIVKVGEGEGAGRAYFLELDARWREFFGHELRMVWKAAEELRERWPIEGPFPYMLGWSASDVSISGGRGARELQMGSSHFWQVAETKVLFGWPDVVELRVSLTLEGPKLQLYVHAPLSRLDGAIKWSAGLAVGRSAEGGWLKRLGVKAKSWDDLKRQVAERWNGVVEAAVRRLGGDVQKELEGLGKRLDDDKVAREAIAPALLLMQAEKLGVDGESLRYFAMVISGAVGGDGYVSAAREEVGLASGERPIALLWAAALAAYGIKAEVAKAGRGFQVVAYGGDAVRLARLYFLYGPPLLEGGDDRLINHKLAEAVELGAEGALNISWEGPRQAKGGLVAADLTISEGGADVKYNVYLRENAIELQFQSTDRSRAELAARLLKLAGVNAEVKKAGGRDEWHITVYTDKLAAGREELRHAIAKIVEAARVNGWVSEKTANSWLEKLRSGITLREGWPRYHVGLTEGALVIRYETTNPGNIEREAQRLREMGLEEDRHFTVKKPEGGKAGYVRILREGLERVAWLSVHGSGVAAEFVEYILQRAGEEGDAVHEKAKEIVDRGREVGSLKLTDIKGRGVDVGGKKYVVTVLGGGAEFDKGESGRTLLRITITAEIDGVRGEYTITFGRYGRNNKAVGYAYIREEADAERFSALVEALTGKRPRIRRMKDGTIMIMCTREHLDGFARYAELAEAIRRWLEETGRR
jgi:hypothetical protein